jgi:hypothetical protein
MKTYSELIYFHFFMPLVLFSVVLLSAQPNEEIKEPENATIIRDTIKTINPNEFGKNQENSIIKEQEDTIGIFKSTATKIGAGIGIGLAGAFLGGFIGNFTSARNTGNSFYEGLDNAEHILVGSLIGFTVLLPTGVYLGGKKLNEKGTLFGTYLGAAVGVAGFGLYAYLRGDKGSVLDIVSITLPIGGSIIGYNLSKKKQF